MAVRRLVEVAVRLVVVSALLGACGTQVLHDAGATSTVMPDPSGGRALATSDPQAVAAAFSGGQSLDDGLQVPSGARLAAPVGRTTAEAVTGWYAVLEPAPSVNAASIAAALVAQARAQGYQLPSDSSTGSRLVGRTSSGDSTTIDVTAFAGSAAFPAYVRVVVTHLPKGVT